jgi:hypothetical protein
MSRGGEEVNHALGQPNSVLCATPVAALAITRVGRARPSIDWFEHEAQRELPAREKYPDVDIDVMRVQVVANVAANASPALKQVEEI